MNVTLAAESKDVSDRTSCRRIKQPASCFVGANCSSVIFVFGIFTQTKLKLSL